MRVEGVHIRIQMQVSYTNTCVSCLSKKKNSEIFPHNFSELCDYSLIAMYYTPQCIRRLTYEFEKDIHSRLEALAGVRRAHLGLQ